VKITIGGLLLALALMAVGCAQAMARHDVLEGSDSRIGRAVETARRTCQERQPKNTLPSAGEYERCVLVTLRAAELTVARQ
jgi:hypothetical protein